MRWCPSCGEANGERARFCSQCATLLDTAVGHRERKMVTVLFCDLVDSTSLGERLDPEALQRVLDRYFAAAREVVDRHGGLVEKFIGDAVVAVFGIPVAHEDDAVRAARTALDLKAELVRVNDDLVEVGVELQIRLGIQTGDIVVDPSNPQLGTIGGDTFNTAARLQAAAEPGGVLVGEGTAELLAGWATLEALPRIELKGKQRPEQVFGLVGVEQTVRAAKETPFVGRSRQLEALRGAFRECVEEQSSVLVTVLGVPGIGKSRLTAQLGSEMSGEATVLVGFTPTYGDAVAYAPVLGLLRTATSAVDPPEVVRGLQAIVANRPDSVAVVDRLTSLMGAEDPSIGGDTAWALRCLLEALAAERPVVVVVEDIHFGGDALLDLLDRVVSSVRGPILVLCTARPELLEQRPSWGGGKPRTVSISLGPLPTRDAAELATHLLGNAGEAARERLTAAAEGNPLYLEQLAALVTENGANEDFLTTPPSLRALLAARLDRLGSLESRVVDLAAIEGRQFHPEVIRLLDPSLDGGEVVAALERLESRSLVTLVEPGSWLFAHALIQDAASRRTSKEDRALLHARLATHLSEADTPSDEVIGAHLERAAGLRRELGKDDADTAELERQAGDRFAAAGSRAYANLDLTATAELLSRAAALLPLHDPRRARLMPDLGVSLMEVGRADEAQRLLESAGEGITGVLRARISIQQLALQGVYRAAPDDEVERCLDEGRRVVEHLKAVGDQTALAEGWVLLEYLNWVLGRVKPAAECCVNAVRAAQAAGRVREQWQAGGDLGQYVASGFLSADEADRALAGFVDEAGPIWELAAAAWTATRFAFHGERAEFDAAQARWADLAAVNGLEWPGAEQCLAMAQARFEIGDPEGAERAVRASMDTMERLGDLWSYSAAAWMLPRALAMQGRRTETLELITKWQERDPLALLDKAAHINERYTTALGLHLRGRLNDAESVSRAGVDLAAETELGVLHTTALEQLADIVAGAGRVDEARPLRQQALSMHGQLGNLVGAARVQAALLH